MKSLAARKDCKYSVALSKSERQIGMREVRSWAGGGNSLQKAGGDGGRKVCNCFLYRQGSKNGICYGAPCQVLFISIMQIRLNDFQIWKKQKCLVLVRREIQCSVSYIYAFEYISSTCPTQIFKVWSVISKAKLKLWLKVLNFIDKLWKKKLDVSDIKFQFSV